MNAFQTSPSHVAVIMDGNGRWAESRGLSRTAGHDQGEERLAEAVRFAHRNGVEWLTVFGFSTENWRRPLSEVNHILALHKKIFGRRDEMHKNNVKIRWIGRDPSGDGRIPRTIFNEVIKATALTKDNTGLNFTLAFDYGGRSEIAQAVSQCVSDGRASGSDLDRHMMTAFLPPVDLLIRTSGENRLSNFILWSLSESYFYTTETAWPDFDDDAFQKALEWWRSEAGAR